LKSANQATAPMYIVNPFRKQGRAAADLTSTHPPISERIHILRAMAGGASYTDYDKAYQQVHTGGAGVMPAAALVGAGAVELRASRPEIVLKEPEPSRVERTREVGDLLWQKSGYKIIDCECGTRLKVPSNIRRATVKCPHCGRTHNI
jgi:heat shock protein HtpX